MAMARARHVPERTCIGCRASAPAEALVRLVAPAGRVTVRPCRTSPAGATGRGAWVHPRGKCLSAAVKANAFARAFRRAVDVPEAAELAAEVTAAFSRRFPSYEQGEKT